MTRHSRALARSVPALILVAMLATVAAGCRGRSGDDGDRPSSVAPVRGGGVSASVRTDPRGFSRLANRDSTTILVDLLTQAKLVRVNQATQEVEPWLAEAWTASPDLRHISLTLRRGLQFSDGQPFTAADVVFTFEAAYDERAASVIGDALRVGGKPLTVTASDDHTVEITFPIPFASGIRLLDNVSVLARHKYEPALKDGTLGKSWRAVSNPAAIVGLGPFVLAEYTPGQRMVFDRNPRFFRKAADGTQLPYLDRVTVDIIPDQNAELLRLESGQLDLMTSEIAPESYAAMKRAADAGRMQLLDLGMSINANALWFNLTPGAFAGDPRAAWIQRDELRRAISTAVDREVFADTVYFGAGAPVFGPETPANKQWFWPEQPKTPHDPSAARQLLASIGISDRNGDGVLEDQAGRPAQFTVLTQKGRPELERGASVIRDELKKIGLTVDVAAVDALTVIQAFVSTRKYDAVFFNADKTNTDPAVNPDFWFSSGSAHTWNIGQEAPATDWERQIDDLMSREASSPDLAERKRLYAEVQRIFAEHLPMLYFAAPRVYVAASSRVINLTPGIIRPQLLWSADTLAVRR